MLVSLATAGAAAAAWRGKVVGVTDGDTIGVLHGEKALKIRIWGIDCPERGQPFGKHARQFSSKAVFGKLVRVEPVSSDRYGRIVARVTWIRPHGPGRDGARHAPPHRLNLGRELLRAGMAWWYRRYAPNAHALARTERQARAARRGLWSDAHPTPPWRWRRARRRR